MIMFIVYIMSLGIIDRASSIRMVGNDFDISQLLAKKLPEKYRVQERYSSFTL